MKKFKKIFSIALLIGGLILFSQPVFAVETVIIDYSNNPIVGEAGANWKWPFVATIDNLTRINFPGINQCGLTSVLISPNQSMSPIIGQKDWDEETMFYENVVFNTPIPLTVGNTYWIMTASGESPEQVCGHYTDDFGQIGFFDPDGFGFGASGVQSSIIYGDYVEPPATPPANTATSTMTNILGGVLNQIIDIFLYLLTYIWPILLVFAVVKGFLYYMDRFFNNRLNFKGGKFPDREIAIEHKFEQDMRLARAQSKNKNLKFKHKMRGDIKH